jgi:hypothetical protein
MHMRISFIDIYKQFTMCLSDFSRLFTCEGCARATTDIDSKSGRSLTRHEVTVTAADLSYM